jgi:hypothetical protein
MQGARAPRSAATIRVPALREEVQEVLWGERVVQFRVSVPALLLLFPPRYALYFSAKAGERERLWCYAEGKKDKLCQKILMILHNSNR